MKNFYPLLLIFLFGFQIVTAQVSDRERGIELYEQKKYSEAVEFLNKSIRLEGADLTSLHYLGLSFEKLDKIDEAAKNHKLAYQKGLYILEKLVAEVYTDTSLLDGKTVKQYLTDKTGTKLELAKKSIERLKMIGSSLANSPDVESALLVFDYYLKTKQADSDSWVNSKNAVNKKLKILSKPHPKYTKQAKKNSTAGEIRVYVMFLANGEIGLVIPQNKLPDGLTEAAIEAAKKIKFEPETKNGEPVTVIKTVVYGFLTF